MQRLLLIGLRHLLFRRLLKGLQRYRTYSREQCVRALNDLQTTKRSGVFQTLAAAKNVDTDAHLFTASVLPSESSLLIIAGSDTTSTALSATLFYLLHNPECLQIAQTEVVTAFEAAVADDSNSGIKSRAITALSCPYLQACIKEALRMSPPVAGLMPRETLAGGMEVDGELFPENDEIGTPHYAIHHNEDYFERPFEYEPQRWLSGPTPASQVALARSAFCAFIVSPRDCIGKAFAYHELLTVLARLLWQFDMRLPPNDTSAGGGDPAYHPGR
jgi:cytochrome P450